jgi:organic radical activating enzyme
MADSRYNALLQWLITDKCNLDCLYCSTKQYAKFEGNIKIDIDAAIRAMDKTGKTFIINVTGGGEPFMADNILELCAAITKKHYLIINTNLTSPKFKLFSEAIDPLKVFYIMASLHIKELERLNLMDRYIDNYLALTGKGFHVIAEEVAHPSLFTEADHYREFFKSRGVPIAFGPFCGQWEGKNYPEAYTAEEKKLFGLKDNIQAVFFQKGRKCNAACLPH